MKKILIALTFFVSVSSLAQQPDSTRVLTDSLTFAKVEVESEYPGGHAGWRRYLLSNMHYPPKAVRKKIQGTVVVQFIIDKDGNVSDVEGLEGPELLKEEGVRLIKSSGKWIPARQDGRSVKSYKKQPFVFKLEK